MLNNQANIKVIKMVGMTGLEPVLFIDTACIFRKVDTSVDTLHSFLE